jgi:hypothetical protein
MAIPIQLLENADDDTGRGKRKAPFSIDGECAARRSSRPSPGHVRSVPRRRFEPPRSGAEKRRPAGSASSSKTVRPPGHRRARIAGTAPRHRFGPVWPDKSLKTKNNHPGDGPRRRGKCDIKVTAAGRVRKSRAAVQPKRGGAVSAPACSSAVHLLDALRLLGNRSGAKRACT